MPPSSYVKSIKSPGAESVISGDSRPMDSHTTTDVVIILVIFLALIIALSILAWRHPTSPSSLHAIPTYGAALPAHNAAPRVHSVATHGRNFTYLMYLQGISLAIYDWWTRSSHSHIDRIRSNTNSHFEHPVARAPSVRAPMGSIRVSTPTPTISFTSSGGASTLHTCVDSDAVELCELDGSKSPYTSSVPETDDADITSIRHVVATGEPVICVHVGPVSEACEPPLSTDCPTAVEIDIVVTHSSSFRVT